MTSSPVQADHDTTAFDDVQIDAIARLNSRAWGIAFGLVAAIGLLAATWTLVLRGGPVVGPHLRLLGVFLPGYSVTWLGGIIGFVYAFVIGYGLGRLLGVVYNRQVSPRTS